MRSDQIAEDQQKSRKRGRKGSPHTPPSSPPAAARGRSSPKQWKHDKFTEGSPVRPHDFDREAENRKR